jgi:hypothetical protein
MRNTHTICLWNLLAHITFDGVRDLVASHSLSAGIGADVTVYHVPEGLKPVYDSNPTSFHVFVRIRPGKVRH